MAESQAMFETPMIAAHTADGYAQAHRALVEVAQAFLDEEDGDSLPMHRHALQLRNEMHAHELRPREKLTRTEVHRNALRRTIDAIYEFRDLEDADGLLISAQDVWDAFESAIKSAARAADRYGPDDTTWAPEDDTNPFKTTPVPEPDPTAEPINGVRQGDYVVSKWEKDAAPRRVLTGASEDGHVRLSDPRDGGWFGGYFVPANYLGREYVRVAASDGDDPPDPADPRAKEQHRDG